MSRVASVIIFVCLCTLVVATAAPTPTTPAPTTPPMNHTTAESSNGDHVTDAHNVTADRSNAINRKPTDGKRLLVFY